MVLHAILILYLFVNLLWDCLHAYTYGICIIICAVVCWLVSIITYWSSYTLRTFWLMKPTNNDGKIICQITIHTSLLCSSITNNSAADCVFSQFITSTSGFINHSFAFLQGWIAHCSYVAVLSDAAKLPTRISCVHNTHTLENENVIALWFWLQYKALWNVHMIIKRIALCGNVYTMRMDSLKHPRLIKFKGEIYLFQ